MNENNEYNDYNNIKKDDSFVKKLPSDKNDIVILTIANLLVASLYLIIVFSVFMQFIPIQSGNWFNLGMGKYVGLAAIFGFYCILTKNYFATFFISLFSSFFVFHEVIIFYDNYAIELGKELTSDGVYRLVFEIFKNAFDIKYGAFWVALCSVLSFIIVTYAWITNTVIQNRLTLDKASE